LSRRPSVPPFSPFGAFFILVREPVDRYQTKSVALQAITSPVQLDGPSGFVHDRLRHGSPGDILGSRNPHRRVAQPEGLDAEGARPAGGYARSQALHP